MKYERLVVPDNGQLTISNQCQLIRFARSTHYYKPAPLRHPTLGIIARTAAIYLEDPANGSRRIMHYLAREAIAISRERVHNLVRSMGLQAIYQKPRTTVPGSPSESFPCLVDLDKITSIKKVWATDIAYIPRHKGFLYLVAIVDLFSRNVLNWKPSNSLDTQFCMDALEMALATDSRPGIFHSDQGYQFTSADFVGWLQAEEIKISLSGGRRCYDNILVERLWRTVKYVAEGYTAKPSGCLSPCL